MYKQPPPKTKDKRDRFYLTESEVMELVEAARKDKRHGNRNGTLILMMFRHGLRTIEAINLKWTQIDLKTGHIFVQRAKNGKDSTQPLRGKEIRGLRQIQRDYPNGNYIFQTERKTPLSTRMVRQIVNDASQSSHVPIKARPHLLRHSCGFHLAQKGIDTRAIQDYLGHKNIHHTVRYTQLSPRRFEDFWKD
ncbi:MAG: tyrosine-type recombinase/integrase [Waterburya sp.]